MLKSNNLIECPNTWKAGKIGDFCEVTKLAGFEFSEHFKYHPNGDIIALRALNINNGKLDLSEIRKISKDISDKLPRSKLYKNDIVITYIGSNTGEIAIVDENDKYHLGPNVAKIKVKSNNIPIFFMYYLSSSFGQTEIKKYLRVTSQPAIPMESIRLIKIIVPPVFEQKKIASILATVDDLIENTGHLINSYALLKKGLMQILLTKGIGHSEFKETYFGIIPLEWEIKKLGDICDIYQPKTITSKDISNNGPYKVYGANGVIGYYNKYNHEEPEVLVTCRGATCGFLNFSDEKSWITGNAMVIKPITKEIRKKFLYFLLMFLDFSKVIEGSAQPQITRTSLSPFLVYIPSIEEQDKITLILLKVNELIKFYNSKKERLLRLKKGLMQQLLTGKIRVKI
jgi:type I restriction enzyme S subunit